MSALTLVVLLVDNVINVNLNSAYCFTTVGRLNPQHTLLLNALTPPLTTLLT